MLETWMIKHFIDGEWALLYVAHYNINTYQLWYYNYNETSAYLVAKYFILMIFKPIEKNYLSLLL